MSTPKRNLEIARETLKKALRMGRITERDHASLSALLVGADSEVQARKIIAQFPPPPKQVAPQKTAKLSADLSRKSKIALKKAQSARREQIAEDRANRIAPDGFRGVDHFLDSLAELVNQRYGGQADLANYLAANTKSVSRWLRRQQIPQQETRDAMAKYYASHVAKKS